MLVNFWFKYSWLMRQTFNLWPPFLLTGIKIEQLSADYRYVRVKLKSRPWTRNINGTQFGGSMFAMTDPIYTTLIMANLGHQYYVWDKSAEIIFHQPGRGAVWFEAVLSDAWLEEIKVQTATGAKFFPQVVSRIVDARGGLVAEVRRTLYVRLKPKYRP